MCTDHAEKWRMKKEEAGFRKIHIDPGVCTYPSCASILPEAGKPMGNVAGSIFGMLVTGKISLVVATSATELGGEYKAPP